MPEIRARKKFEIAALPLFHFTYFPLTRHVSHSTHKEFKSFRAQIELKLRIKSLLPFFASQKSQQNKVSRNRRTHPGKKRDSGIEVEEQAEFQFPFDYELRLFGIIDITWLAEPPTNETRSCR